ncbi:sensor histidine kinase [Lacihabitans sp. CCS-44]|uniref:sensor histidine kinase n=1 Tax=Lacihabitans sp. CCS-44 TaxID=2487331 RepID=UPI0020CC48D4|nr:sensor histidine kinase [Lacihabitans sp. CCS-44]
MPAIGRVIALDTMPKPENTPMGKTETIPVGKPSSSPIAEQKRPITWQTVKAGEPKIFTPGKDSVLKPTIQPAMHKPKLAGVPKINIAKEPHSLDYNPFNLLIYGMKEGLIESQVHSLFQDKKGNIWTGSFNGISKYNGHTFENYTRKEGLVDNFFTCGLEDHEGNIWLGFRDGLTKFDGKYFTNYTTNEGLSSNAIASILEDKQGNIWLGTSGGGACMLDKARKNFHHFGLKQGLSTIILSMVEDKKGNIWFGTQEHGLFKYDFKSFARYGFYEGLTFVTVNDLKIDNDGQLWMAMWTGVSRFDGTHFHHFTGELKGYASKMTIDKNDHVWFGGQPGGLYQIDKHQNLISTISQSQGLPDVQAFVLLADKNGNIWFGTDNGLIKYTKLVQNLTEKDGLVGFQISSVVADHHKNIWVGAYDGGVSKIDYRDKKIHTYTPKEGLIERNIISILEDSEENVWFGTEYSNLFKLNKGGKTFTSFKDSGTYIVCVFEDKAGNIWYSSRDKGEVIRINKSDNTRTHFSPKQGLPHSQVVRIWQDSGGNMWFCTFNGVSQLDAQGKFLTNFTEKEGFKFGVVESVVEDKHGNFWFSTLADGITHLNLKNKTFINFTEKDRFSNNTSFGILKDKKGNLWFNTRQGLSKLSAQVVDQLASKNPLSKSINFKNYTSEQGYLGFGGGRFDILEDSAGKIWLPMVDRLTIFDPNQESLDLDKPTVEITKVKLFNENINWQKDTTITLKNGLRVGDFEFQELSKWNALPVGLKLAYNHNYLNFEFAGINVNTPAKLSYQYILEGLDKTWSVSSSRSEAIYGNLPAGYYTFKVKASNGGEKWSETVSYSFTIKPPFWKTWWAYSLYFLLLGCLIYWLIQVRVERGLKRIKSLEIIRTKISSDLHDDVGSILSGLAMQSQMMAFNAKDQLKDNLLELSQMSQEAMERMRDTVWAIDSRKDKYENLVDKMREFAEKSFHLKQINHVFKTEIDDSKRFINPDKRQNIYLIFKEAVTNICKHSDATFVDIYLKQDKGNFTLKIKDNGILKPNVKSEGTGLINMKMRAKSIGFILEFESNDGFTIILEKKAK